MPSVESILMNSIKKRIQKSPILSGDRAFLDSIKVTFFGGILAVEYQDDDGNIVKVESTNEESNSETANSTTSSETTETVTKTQVQINRLKNVKKQNIEDAIKDAVPKILEKLLFK